MKKKLFSLALALALCLGLAVPVSAAGTKKVVEDGEHGLKITLNGFLREETHYYSQEGGVTWQYTLCVVEDNSTVTVEAMEGRKYATQAEMDAHVYDVNWWTKVEMGLGGYIWPYDGYYSWDSESNSFSFGAGGEDPAPMTGPVTITAAPAESEIQISCEYGVYWICESDFAKLVPAKPLASNWAMAEVEKAYNAKLMPMSPYEKDCTQGMTRAEFAAVTVRLYAAMIGTAYFNLDVSTEHPFTDVEYDDNVGRAYNLGFVKGAGNSLFKPGDPLTRQEAAVMLGRVYAKVHGEIPKAANTAFADDRDVASWAKSEVAFMSGQGIVKGVGGSRFAPTKALTIQEAVIMANRMLEKLK